MHEIFYIHVLQVYEAGNELVEAREEADLLRLQLELAQQEEVAAKRALAASQAALAAALAAPEEFNDATSAQDDVSASDLHTRQIEVPHYSGCLYAVPGPSLCRRALAGALRSQTHNHEFLF